MAYFVVQIHSEVLQAEQECIVTLPDTAISQRQTPIPTLWVLHGAFGDGMSSHNLVSLEREAGARGLATVHPSVYHGFYMDMAYGERWYTFLSQELRPRVQGLFPRLSHERNALLGLSLGGYGAFKWALNEPERFEAAGAFSSPLDMRLVMNRLEHGLHPGGHDLFDAFGSEARVAGSRDDVLDLLHGLLANGGHVPRLFQLCGTEDFAWEENVLARDQMRAMGATLTFRSGTGGHTNAFWDAHLTEFLDWLGKEEA